MTRLHPDVPSANLAGMSERENQNTGPASRVADSYSRTTPPVPQQKRRVYRAVRTVDA